MMGTNDRTADIQKGFDNDRARRQADEAKRLSRRKDKTPEERRNLRAAAREIRSDLNR
jgi:hypothetical protein